MEDLRGVVEGKTVIIINCVKKIIFNKVRTPQFVVK